MLIIDRIEENWAVVEYDNQIFNLPRSLLPKSVKEGDVLQLTITVDQEATIKQKKKSDALLDDFFDA